MINRPVILLVTQPRRRRRTSHIIIVACACVQCMQTSEDVNYSAASQCFIPLQCAEPQLFCSFPNEIHNGRVRQAGL